MKKIKTIITTLDKHDLAALIVFVLQLYLSLGLLTPTLREINLFDESVYANTGRLLAQGRLTPFSRNPLVGAVYALTYLPFSGSDFWLVGSLSVGRVVMFTLMWWAAYLVFKQIKTGVPALVMAGLLFTSPVRVNIVRNQSDSLFAAFSGFAHNHRVIFIPGLSDDFINDTVLFFPDLDMYGGLGIIQFNNPGSYFFHKLIHGFMVGRHPFINIFHFSLPTFQYSISCPVSRQIPTFQLADI